jgi:hydrogenase maturation factor
VPLTVVAALGISVSPGDLVLVHTGLAESELTPEEAAERAIFLTGGAANEDS